MSPEEIKEERRSQKVALKLQHEQKEDASTFSRSHRVIEESKMRKAQGDDPDSFANVKYPVYIYDEDEIMYAEDVTSVPNRTIFMKVGYND